MSARNMNNEMPSVKLFKRLTTLKKEKSEVEREVFMLKEKLENAYFAN